MRATTALTTIATSTAIGNARAFAGVRTFATARVGRCARLLRGCCAVLMDGARCGSTNRNRDQRLR
jgi:hypothetical protein